MAPTTVQPDLSYKNLLKIRALQPKERDQQLQQLKAQVQAISAAATPLPPPMDVAAYLSALKSVDITNDTSFETFLNATQIVDVDYLPKPIPLGTHAGYQYYLLSSDSTITLDGSKNQHGDFRAQYTALTIPQYKPLATDLNTGFGLGKLYHRATTTSPATWENLDYTGFYLVASAKDKSIWAAFDFKPTTQTGDIGNVQPEYGDKYGLIPNDPNLVIGLQKLFGKEWLQKSPLSLDGGDPFKNNLGGGTPIAAKLTSKPAVLADVVKDAKGSGAGSAAGAAP